jgi:integrase/recombinase XerD
VREPDDGTVFLHADGRPFIGNRLSDLVRRYLEAIGIESPGACHLLRHAMATEMLAHGADIRYLQAILGHAQLTTTERYTHVTIEQLKSVHAATHPAEQSARRENPRT